MKSVIIILLLGYTYLLSSQTINAVDSNKYILNENFKFHKKQLIIPTIFLTYGVLSIESDYLKLLNTELREELGEAIDEKFSIDDISQYTPALSVYGLNCLGIKGKNNLRDRSLVLGTSYLLMSSTVLGLKSLSKVKRPDGTANNSFPSGHTATAFLGAEFLRQEYGDISIWYSIAGYTIATGTGFFRIYNRRHWLSDVAMGAGIGIISAKAGYWLLPYINKRIFRKKKNKGNALVMPFYNGNDFVVTGIVKLR